MVQIDPNLYILGGTAQEFLMIPNIESFKQFCKNKKDANIYYSYMNYRFKNDDLVLIEFPAYFYLSNIENVWKKISKETCLEQVDEIICDCEEKIQCLKIFKDSINKQRDDRYLTTGNE